MALSLRVHFAGALLLTLAVLAAVPPATAAAVADLDVAAGQGVAPIEAAWYNCVDEVREDSWWKDHFVSAFLGPAYAKDFGDQAASNGWAVDDRPEAGDVAVFPAGAHGSGYGGHVAIVIEVQGATISVRERGSRPPGTIRTGLEVVSGMQFVHRRRTSSAAPAPPAAADACVAAEAGDAAAPCAAGEAAPPA